MNNYQLLKTTLPVTLMCLTSEALSKKTATWLVYTYNYEIGGKMNTTDCQRRKVSYVLLRDYCGNIWYTRVGDKMPPVRIDEDDNPTVTSMDFFSTQKGVEEQFYITIELSNGNRELWNIEQIEDYKLETA